MLFRLSFLFKRGSAIACALRTFSSGNRALNVAPSSMCSAAPVKHNVKLFDSTGMPIEKDMQFFNSFSDVNRFLPSWLVSGVNELGFKETTEIQGSIMPLFFSSEVLKKSAEYASPVNIVGLAPTGSGKTIAFAVPLLAKMKRTGGKGPFILVLAPVRELVKQTANVFRSLCSFSGDEGEDECSTFSSAGPPLVVAEAYGGPENRRVQEERIRQGCDILIACPGRLMQFVETGLVDLSGVQFFVLDEADRLLDMGFKAHLDIIFDALYSSRRARDTPLQSLMWSATWSRSIGDLAGTYLGSNFITVRVGKETANSENQVNTNIEQHVCIAKNENDRQVILKRLIDQEIVKNNSGKMIVFCEKQSDTEELMHHLAHNSSVDPNVFGVMHGKLTQTMRERILKAFRLSRIRVLIATDVAARGLDIRDVSAVVNYDNPTQIASYFHRIGRTGRAGASGKAFTIFMRSIRGPLPSHGHPSALAAPLIKYFEELKISYPRELRSIASEYAAHEYQKKSEKNSKNSYKRKEIDGFGWGGPMKKQQNNYNSQKVIWDGY